jgi:hypothetical protein
MFVKNDTGADVVLTAPLPGIDFFSPMAVTVGGSHVPDRMIDALITDGKLARSGEDVIVPAAPAAPAPPEPVAEKSSRSKFSPKISE